MSDSSFIKPTSNDFICTPTDLNKLIGPYGYVQCTCERYPKVTHINPQMIEFLDRTEQDNLESFLKENIFYTMIPFEERNVVIGYLEQAQKSDRPIHIEHSIRCKNGVVKQFTGWISVIETDEGNKEYAFIYNLRDKNNVSAQENAYFNALKNTYDVIFAINPINDTIECVHGRETSNLGSICDVIMTIDSGIDFWINNHMVGDDRNKMRTYLEHICSASSKWDAPSIQCKFRLEWNGITSDYIGNGIKLDSFSVLFCVSRVEYHQFTTTTTKEAIAFSKLDDLLDQLVKDDKEALGMLLYEKRGDNYSLLYASEAVRNYLQISQEDYLSYISEEYPSQQCLEMLKFRNEDFQKLIKKKQMSYSVKLDDERVMNIIITCTPHYHGNSAVYEVIINDEDSLSTANIPSTGVFARTFGHFDLFVDGQPITFTSEKEKELMALLIDRNGGTLTTNEAISCLWEDEEINDRTSTKYRKLAMGLKNTLAKHNIENIIINHHGVRNVDTNAILCDYYELLAGNKHYQKLFHNLYMTNYSWAEETLATLWDYS